MNRPTVFLASVVVLACASAAASADSIWPCGGVSLIGDNKAYRAGDIVTVIVEEDSKVSNSAGSSLSKSTDMTGELETLNVPRGNNVFPVFKGDTPSVAAKSARSVDGKGTYTLQGSMQTRLTAIVMDVLPNGNLVIEGSRLQQSVNEKVHIRISGIVRPQDIAADNTVLSTSVAEGKIVFETSGPVSRSSQYGFLNRIIDFIWPF